MSDNLQEHMRSLAARNRCEGVFHEPRIYYAPFYFDASLEKIQADPGVFRNGEQFPVRIKHLVMGVIPGGSASLTPAVGDERCVQFYGLQIKANDAGYLNTVFHVPLPLWANKQIATADNITRGTATWKFDKPFVLSNRDSMEIRVQLLNAPTQGQSRRVAVSLDGVGLLSGRPYKFADNVAITTAGQTLLDPDRYRNDGVEPVEIQELTLLCGGQSAESSPVGAIEQLTVQIRQIGNGTNAKWQNGPIALDPGNALLNYCPAGLLGATTGRWIVHELPGEGWIWEPNEGVTVEMLSYDTTRDDHMVVAALGYIMAV